MWYFWSHLFPPWVKVQNSTAELKNKKQRWLRLNRFQTVCSDRREISLKTGSWSPHLPLSNTTQGFCCFSCSFFFVCFFNCQPSPHLRPSPGICSTPSARARPWEPWSRRGGRSLRAPSCAYVCPRWSHNPGDWRRREEKRKKMVGFSSLFKAVVRSLPASGAGSTSDGNLLPRNQSHIVGRGARNCPQSKNHRSSSQSSKILNLIGQNAGWDVWNYTLFYLNCHVLEFPYICRTPFNIPL